MVNYSELERVWGWVQAHPETYDQRYWGAVKPAVFHVDYDEWNPDWGKYTSTVPLCQTSMCFAGAAVMLDGWRLMFGEEDDRYATHCVKDGEVRDVAGVAAELLNLPIDDWRKLFHSRNTEDDMEWMIKHLKEYGSLETFEHEHVKPEVTVRFTIDEWPTNED